MFNYDFGTMEIEIKTKDKIEPHHMMITALDLYELYSRRIYLVSQQLSVF